VNRAAVSVAANIAEGFDRGSRAEFHRFLVIAKGSSGEVRSHLYIALDRGYVSQARFDDLLERTLEVARLVGGLRSSVFRQRRQAPPLIP
jgi:four helix bundle protein